MRQMKHITISRQYSSEDGRLVDRTRDPTFQRRPYLSIASKMKEGDPQELIMPGVEAYERGEYEVALPWFERAVERNRELIDQLHPYIDVCERVLATEKNRDDHRYELDLEAWQRKSVLARLFASAPSPKVRCKHCGHYTLYVHPNEGGPNSCQQCGRTYPVPDFVWDSVDGQAYMYYRRSVQDEAFYREFRERYNVVTTSSATSQ